MYFAKYLFILRFAYILNFLALGTNGYFLTPLS